MSELKAAMQKVHDALRDKNPELMADLIDTELADTIDELRTALTEAKEALELSLPDVKANINRLRRDLVNAEGILVESAAKDAFVKACASETKVNAAIAKIREVISE